MKPQILAVGAALALLTSACATQNDSIVVTNQQADAKMSCPQIASEMERNKDRALMLVRENGSTANVAMDVNGELVLGEALVALYANSDDTTMIYSLRDRNRRLAKLSYANHCTIDGTRWAAQGLGDACGYDWSIEVAVRKGQVRGALWRGDVKYDVYGEVDAKGRMIGTRAGRNPASFGWPGARYVNLSIEFQPDNAAGQYGIESGGGIACATPVTLRRLDG